jgi:hypothetical protein
MVYLVYLAAFLSLPVGSLELLPADGFLGSWQREEPARVFGANDLFGHINGGSELFLEYGFEELVVQEYVNGEDTFSVELYRMSDQVAATGIYLMKKGKESAGGRLRVRHTLSPYQLLFACDRYLVILNNTEGREQRQPEMLDFGADIVARLPQTPAFDPRQLLPAAGLVSGSERVIRGPYALQSVFTLGDNNILSLAPGQIAAAADYQRDGSGFSLLVCDYADETGARRALTYMTAHLDPYLKVLEQGPRLVFQDYAGNFGMAEAVGKRLEIRVHLKQKPPRQPGRSF